jgi:hypothetical protein
MATRRNVILGSLGVLAIGLWGLSRGALEAEIARILRRRLAYLRLDEPGLHAFAREQTALIFNKRLPKWNHIEFRFLTEVSPHFKRYYRSSDRRSRIARIEDNLVSWYMLSSDFFIRGCDDSRIVRYVAYFDPLRPCSNPFARPVMKAEPAIAATRAKPEPLPACSIQTRFDASTARVSGIELIPMTAHS